MANKDLYEKLANKFLGESDVNKDEDIDEKLKTNEEGKIVNLKKEDEDAIASAFGEEEDVDNEKKKDDVDIEDDLKDVEDEVTKNEEDEVNDEKVDDDNTVEVAGQDTEPSEGTKEKKDKSNDEEVELDKEEEKLLDDMISGGGSNSLTGVVPNVLAGNLPTTKDKYSGWTQVVNNVMESVKRDMAKLAKKVVKERRAARFWKKMFMEEKKKSIYNDLTNSRSYELSDRERKRIKKILDKCQHVHTLNMASDMIRKVIVENKEKIKRETLKEYKDAIKDVKRFIE